MDAAQTEVYVPVAGSSSLVNIYEDLGPVIQEPHKY